MCLSIQTLRIRTVRPTIYNRVYIHIQSVCVCVCVCKKRLFSCCSLTNQAIILWIYGGYVGDIFLAILRPRRLADRYMYDMRVCVCDDIIGYRQSASGIDSS